MPAIGAGPDLGAAAPAVLISARPGMERFCRAGRCFGAVPTRLTLDELGSEALALIQAESNLVVTEA